jgi:hypothetical protein
MKTTTSLVAVALLAVAGAAHGQTIPATDVVRVNFDPVGSIAGEVAGRIRNVTLAPQASVANSPSFNQSNLVGGSGSSQITTGNSSLFLSFCLERDDYASPGAQYFYRLTDYAAFGGANNANPSAGTVFNPANLSHTDQLSFRSAYLFRQFWDATLTGYDFTGSGRAGDANSLQMAFWMMEGEVQLPLFSSLSSANQATLTTAGFGSVNYNLVRDMLIAEANANGSANLSVGGTGETSLPIDRWIETLSFLNLALTNANQTTDYGVRVINLWSNASNQTWETRGQDFMVVVPTATSIIPLPPAGMAGVATLLGLGAMSAGRRRRISN